MEIEFILRNAGERVYDQLIDILPEATLAILVIVVGVFAASILYHICVRILLFFAVDKLAGKTPIEKILKSIGFKKSISQIFALLVFWLTLLLTLIFASEILDLQPVSDALIVVTRYIPQIIAALLILFFGMLLARFVQSLISQALSRTDLGHEQNIGKAVYMIILIFVFIVAVQQLGFELTFLTTNVLMAFFALVIIFGIGLVVASRTILENMVACYEIRSHIKPGDSIEITGIKGKIKEITFTSVILKHDDRTSVLPAHLFFTEIYTIS